MDEEAEILNLTLTTTEEEFFDAKEARTPSKEGQSTPYAQLASFAGLSSPNLGEMQSGKEGSVISSLSSESERRPSTSTQPPADSSPPIQPTNLRKKLSANSGSPSSLPASPPQTPRSPPPTPNTPLTAQEEAQLVNHIFSPLVYTEKVKVVSNLPDRQSTFKDNLRLVQTLSHHVGPIWCMKFSPNGQYLCSGGQDSKIFIWCVSSAHEKNFWSIRKTSSEYSIDFARNTPSPSPPLMETAPGEVSYTAPLFLTPEPYRVFEGHAADVIDVSWSKSCFVLSASVDKTIRLWHVTRNDCLQYFRHPDIVTSVEFHPLHDRYFASGCFDRRLRVWDIIPDGNVREWAQAPDTITSLCYSPDGLTLCCGLMGGVVYFYEAEGCKYKTQMDAKNRGGKFRSGTKVSGVGYVAAGGKARGGAGMGGSGVYGLGTTAAGDGNAGAGGESPSPSSQLLLVTTNDHRIRLVNLEDYSPLLKLRGARNGGMQIKATVSEGGSGWVIMGGDQGAVSIWRLGGPAGPGNSAGGWGAWWKGVWGGGRSVPRINQNETFDCSGDSAVPTPVALFAPVDGVRAFLAAQKELLTSEDSGATVSSVGDVGGDLGTRVIATADLAGNIRVYFRVNSAV